MKTNLLTTAQAAIILGVTPQEVKKKCQRGTLRGEKIGRDWLILEAEITIYLLKKIKTPSQ